MRFGVARRSSLGSSAGLGNGWDVPAPKWKLEVRRKEGTVLAPLNASTGVYKTLAPGTYLMCSAPQ